MILDSYIESMATKTMTKTRTAVEKAKTRGIRRVVNITERRRWGRNTEQSTKFENVPSSAAPTSTKQTTISRQAWQPSRTQRPSKIDGQAARKGSDPSSSNQDSSRNGSKRTSSDMTGGSCSARSSENQRRRSNAPLPRDSLLSALSSKKRSLPQQKLREINEASFSGKRLSRKKPNRLNLSFVPKAQLDIVAYRADSLQPRSKKPRSHSGYFTDPFASTESSRRSERPPKVRKRPSPKSLREARLRRFSQAVTHKRDRIITSHLPHLVAPFASYVSTPERSRSRSSSRAVSRDGSHRVKMHQKRANVNVRLTNISVSDIAIYARDGYVVDIVSSFIARELPMSESMQALTKKYTRWGEASLDTGPVNTAHGRQIDGGNPWQQFAYISHLNMADIGRDSRRRTLTHVDEMVRTESWTVLLVPLRTSQADDLREVLLAQQASRMRALSRRQSLGSEIANSIEEYTARSMR